MIFGINLGTHNIGLKCGRAKWQDGRPQEKISVLYFLSHVEIQTLMYESSTPPR